MIRSLPGIVLLVIATASQGVTNVQAQVPDWPSERPPRPLPAREVRFPPYSMRTLGNGLQVIAVSHHEQPAVSLRLLIRAGGASDPADKPGVAALAAAVLDQGTTTRSAEQIATTIDSVGGVIGSGSVTEMSSIHAIVMKDSFNLALDLVSDIARNPAFSTDEIERQRQQILSGLKVSYDDPEYLAGVVFDRLVYGFHPYGRPDAGTPESIAAITRQDLVGFHRSWFGPNNAILAIVGDVSADEAFSGAERAFGKWAKSDSNAASPTDIAPPVRRLVIIDRPGAVQTEIRVGHVGLSRKHPDYLALDLAIKILGGEGGNRLHRVLRSERGLTYGASADIHALKDGGNVVAETDTRSESTAEALRLIVDELSRLQRQRVSSRELGDAQAYLTGSFPLTIETPGAIALQILNAVFFGLSLDELQTFRERVNAITADDIQRVARAYLHPDRLSIVLVGDANVFAKQLAGVGFDEFERIGINELDLASADLRRGPRSAPDRLPIAYRPLQSTPPAGEVRTLIGKAVAAKGGADKLRSIKTVKAVAETVIETAEGRVSVPTVTSIRYPGWFRVDADMPAGKVTQVFAAGEYWIVDGRGVRPGPPEMAEAIRGTVQRDSIALLLALLDGKVIARRAPDVVVDGLSLPALQAELAPGGPLTLVLDPVSGLIVKARYGWAPADSREPQVSHQFQTEEDFADYRDVNGLSVAHTVTVRRAGSPAVTRLLRTLEVNIPLDPTLFAKPS